VIIITGYASLDSAIQAVRVGANDYLTKPFALGQIEVILGQVRERFALEHGRARLARESRIDERLVQLDQRMERIEAALERLETRITKIGNPQ
jgi:two-component system response regulator HydG